MEILKQFAFDILKVVFFSIAGFFFIFILFIFSSLFLADPVKKCYEWIAGIIAKLHKNRTMTDQPATGPIEPEVMTECSYCVICGAALAKEDTGHFCRNCFDAFRIP